MGYHFVERCHRCRVVSHEVPHVISQSQKTSKRGISGWFREIHHRSDFAKGHRGALFADLSAYILDSFHTEFALFRLQEYAVFVESLEN